MDASRILQKSINEASACAMRSRLTSKMKKMVTNDSSEWLELYNSWVTGSIQSKICIPTAIMLWNGFDMFWSIPIWTTCTSQGCSTLHACQSLMGPSISIQVDPGGRLFHTAAIPAGPNLEISWDHGVHPNGWCHSQRLCGSVGEQNGCSHRPPLWSQAERDWLQQRRCFAQKCCECDLFEKQISSQGTND